MRDITEQQRRLAEAYVCSPEMSVAKAGEQAGYNSRQAAHEAINLPQVQEYIAELRAERMERVNITADYVLTKIRDTVERCSQAEPVKDKEGKETGEYKFDAANVLKGCELLGKHLGMWTEKHEVTGKDGAPLQPPVFNIVGVCPNGSGDSE